jgi:hypothetical protein
VFSGSKVAFNVTKRWPPPCFCNDGLLHRPMKHQRKHSIYIHKELYNFFFFFFFFFVERGRLNHLKFIVGRHHSGNDFQYYSCCLVSGPVFVFIWGGIYSKASTWEEKSLLLWPSIQHFDISTTFYLLTIINSSHMSIRYIQMNWKSKIP